MKIVYTSTQEDKKELISHTLFIRSNEYQEHALLHRRMAGVCDSREFGG